MTSHDKETELCLALSLIYAASGSEKYQDNEEKIATWCRDTGHLHSASNMCRCSDTVSTDTSPLITGDQVTRSSLHTDIMHCF